MQLYRLFGKRRSWFLTGRGVRHKNYSSYDEYLAHQKAKLSSIKNLDKKWERLKTCLHERLADIPEVRRGANCLCLGARLGAEVEAFIDFGVFAIGIDLNPGKDNRYVVTGDFHHVQYAEASIDVIYSNSLDHVFNLKEVLAEVLRLLKPSGLFIVDLIHGSKDAHGRDPGYFASSWWDHSDEMIRKISATGLAVHRQREFVEPWAGIQAIFRKP